MLVTERLISTPDKAGLNRCTPWVRAVETVFIILSRLVETGLDRNSSLPPGVINFDRYTHRMWSILTGIQPVVT